MLLTVPVLVAASIGFGGAGGISSLASGPHQSSIAVSTETLSAGSSIESLTAKLPLETPASVRRQEQRSAGQGVGGVGGTETPTDAGSQVSAPSTGGGVGGGSGAPGDAGTGTGGGTPTAPDPGSVGIDITNPGGSGDGLIAQLLQGLNLTK